MTKTSNYKFMIFFRLIAGLVLLVFGIIHFLKPEPLQNILIASGIPMVELNLYLVPFAETLSGILMLLGWYTRIGGLIGAGTMLGAVYSTIVLAKMTVANLPDGLTEIPFVPALPIPIGVLICTLVIIILGGGAWSLDLYNQRTN